MLKNYLKLSIRHLLRRKTQSIINFFGLSIGMGACIVLILYARYELSYDKFHEKANNIYMVYKERHLPSGMQITRDTWAPMAESLLGQIPEIKNATRYYNRMGIIEVGENTLEEAITYTDPALFSMFTFPLLSGDPQEIFSDQNALFLSEDKAVKLFGNNNPLGKTIRIDYEKTYTVKGVIKNIPDNSSLEMEIVIPLSSVPSYENFKDEWGSSFLYTYIELNESATPQETESKFPDFITTIWNEELNNTMKLRLDPLIELHNNITGSDKYAYILIGVAIAILLIAALNFTNLKTASSMERIRETGLRKAIGSSKGQLFKQFIFESVIVSLTALILGVIFSETVLPVINRMYDANISLYQERNLSILISLIPFAVIVGLLSGAYPAYAIANLRPIKALQGEMNKGKSGGVVRRFLVIFQFAISVLLISGTIFMWNQINLMKNADLGFEQENRIIIPIDLGFFEDSDDALTKIGVFREDLKKNPDIVSTSSSTHVPGNWPGWFTFVYPEGWERSDRLRMRVCYVDDKFFKEFAIDFIDGRNFDENLPTDADESLIINQAALDQIGWDDPIAKTISLGGKEEYKIIGVVDNYHFLSVADNVGPIIHSFRPSNNGVHNYLTVSISGKNIPDVLKYMEKIWKNVDASRNFEYYFLDQQFQEQYESEESLFKLMAIFTILSILIASMGLFAISSIIVKKKTKEVAVKKVFGSTSLNIVFDFFKSFTIWVFIANIIAIPISWWFVERWLRDFVYRIEIRPGVFILTLLISWLIALITVYFQSMKVANTNPAESLRYE